MNDVIENRGGSNKKAARNKEIYERFRKGISSCVLAKEYGLTRQRVLQIKDAVARELAGVKP